MPPGEHDHKHPGSTPDAALRPFSDHFSTVASGYAAFRPRYPDALFDWLADSAVPDPGHAWDCGCGSGQATIGLLRRFRHVSATDASAAQIAHAPRGPRVACWVARAERSALAAASVDLVAVAQALHWFDLPAFYTEVRRVLATRGALAVWSYGVPRLSPPALDRDFHRFYHDVIGPYWPPGRRHVEAGYRTLDFPFREVAAPAFEMTTEWSWSQLAGYVSSWSAAARYRAAKASDPVATLAEYMGVAVDSAGPSLVVRWPLALRVGIR